MAVTIGRGSFGGIGFDISGGEDKSQADLRDDERIINNIQKIDYNVTQVKGLVDAIGTAADSKTLRNNLHTLLQLTSTLTRETGQTIKTYSQVRPENEDDQKEWKLKQDRFKDDFQKVLERYQKIHAEARKQERVSLRQTLMKSGYHDLEISESGEITKDGEQYALEMLQKEEEENIELIKEREAALKQLEQDIVDINGIFHDIHNMVQTQGEEITEIEKNVEKAAEDVEVAVKDLEKADDNMASARKKKIAGVLIVFILLAVLALILALTLS